MATDEICDNALLIWSCVGEVYQGVPLTGLNDNACKHPGPTEPYAISVPLRSVPPDMKVKIEMARILFSLVGVRRGVMSQPGVR